MKQEKITGFLIDVKNQIARRVETPDELEAYYSLLNCSTIEIHPVIVGTNGKIYDCICDEEGNFVDDQRISALDNFGNVVFVGSLLIVGTADEEGELTSLNEEDVWYLERFAKNIKTLMHPEGNIVLTECRM